MKNVTVVFIVIMTTLLMSCGNKGNDDSKKTTLVGTESDAKIEASASQQKLPNDFPDDVYIIKGTIANVSTIKIENKKTVSFYLSEELSPKEIRDEIVKNMEASAWTTNINVASQMYFSKEDNTVKIGIGEGDNTTELFYSVTY